MSALYRIKTRVRNKNVWDLTAAGTLAPRERWHTLRVLFLDSRLTDLGGGLPTMLAKGDRRNTRPYRVRSITRIDHAKKEGLPNARWPFSQVNT